MDRLIEIISLFTGMRFLSWVILILYVLIIKAIIMETIKRIKKRIRRKKNG